MQVNLSFDTEREGIDNLKKLVDALQQLIASREGKPYSPEVKPATATVPEQKAAPDRTSGGCRVIPYEDMSGKMSSLFSGRRI